MWVSVRLATPSVGKTVRVVGSASPSPQYLPGPGGQSIIVRRQGADKQPDLEIRRTEEGLLIRPANPKQ